MYVDDIKEGGFADPYNTMINVHTVDFDFNLAFIEFEDDTLLGILVTDKSGREKLKIVNKDYIEYIEIVYQDDLDMHDSIKSEEYMFN